MATGDKGATGKGKAAGRKPARKRTPSRRPGEDGPAPDRPAAALLRLSEITGHVRPRRLLAAALTENRLFPALLLHGPVGIGKLTTAKELLSKIKNPARERGRKHRYSGFQPKSATSASLILAGTGFTSA